MRGAIFLPQQRQGDALASHFLVDVHPTRPGTCARRLRRRSRREQKALQRPVVEIDGQGPPQARHAGALEIGVHRAVAERHRTRDHALAQPPLELQTQDIADFPHRQSLGWHGPLPAERGPIGPGDCRRTPLPGSSRGCSRSRGIRAQDRVETLLRIAWTECSRSSGIGAQDHVDYAFTCKATSHKVLYDFIDGAELSRHEEKIRRRNAKETFRYPWIEAVPIRDGKDALVINWIGFEILDAKGKAKYSMAWVTSLPVSKDNVAEIVACGRARWKIENESFNVLKNHGYELEHNFGHGQRFLAMTLAALNLLAFAWHTMLELLEPPWQAAREAAVKRTSFFAHILMLSAYVIFPSWPVFLESLATFSIPPDLIRNRDSP